MRFRWMLVGVLGSCLLLGQEVANGEKAAAATGTMKAAHKATATTVDPATVAKRVSAFREALGRTHALGKAAARAVTRERRKQKVAAARPVLRAIEKQLKKMPAAKEAPKDDEIKKLAAELSSLAAECVLFAADGLKPLAAVIAEAQEEEKVILVRLHEQLYCQIALNDIGQYMDEGATPGTFDGMFEKTSGYERQGAEAFIRVFMDIDQPLQTRLLAGEGVAQMGTKDDIKTVRALWDDDLEDQTIRKKAKEVMARLGDDSLIAKDLSGWEEKLADQMGKHEKLLAEFEELRKKAVAAGEVAEPSEAQQAELKSLREALQKKNMEVVDSFFRIGVFHNQIAQVYQAVRRNKETESSYEKCLGFWNNISGLLQRTPRHKSTVSFAYYNLACVESLQKKTGEALTSFENSLRWGYDNYKWAETDGDLRNIREVPAFAKLMTEVKSGEAQKRWRQEAEAAQKEMEAKQKAGAAAPDGDGSGATKKPDGDS